MPRFSTILEVLGYGCAVVFALVVDPRILLAEIAIALIAIAHDAGRHK